MFQMMGVFAELERALIQERVKAGMARAKAQGKHVGRPRTTGDKEELLLLALREGSSLRAPARIAGISIATASRIREAATPRTELP
jgi:DNA invertase Pin-like site-specific DNA recombinase